MKILVTGGTGLLGTDLVALLAEQKHSILKPDSKDLDISNAAVVQSTIEKSNPQLFIHCARYTDVDGCEKDQDKAIRINGLGTKNIAESCEKLDIPIVYLSTDYVFNGNNQVPYRESDPIDPINVYGMSKLMGERYIQKATLKYFIVRTSWVYGKGGRNFVDTILDKAKTALELKVVNDQIGSPTWSVDLSKAIADLIVTSEYGIYHITNNGICSWFDFAQKILEFSEIEGIKVIPASSQEINRPARRPAYSKLNTDSFQNTTGHKLRTWEEALKDYMKTKGALKEGI